MRFIKAPVQFCTTCLAIFCHLLFFTYLTWQKKDPLPKKCEQRIVVRTKSSPPPSLTTKPSVVAAPITIAPPKPPPVTQSSPPARKTKPAVSAQTPKTPIAKKKNPVPRQLVQKLEESIAKIEKKPDNYRGEEKFVLPEKIKSPSHMDIPHSSATNTSDLLTDVKGELARQLQTSLHLPDFGEVKVQIELSESGKIENVKVLKAASQKNHDYLIRELPRMSFPSLSLHKLSGKERVFIISFHNEMTR